VLKQIIDRLRQMQDADEANIPDYDQIVEILESGLPSEQAMEERINVMEREHRAWLECLSNFVGFMPKKSDDLPECKEVSICSIHHPSDKRIDCPMCQSKIRKPEFISIRRDELLSIIKTLTNLSERI